MFSYINTFLARVIIIFALMSFSSTLMAQLLSDKIVAVVNDDVITSGELQERISLLRSEGRVQAVNDAIQRRVLTSLVEERVQLQRAAQLDINISAAEERQIIQRFLNSQGGVNLEQVKQTLSKRGMKFETVLNGLKTRALIQKLVRRDTVRSVSVTDEEIDSFIKANNIKATPKVYDVSFVLIKTESDLSDQQLNTIHQLQSESLGSIDTLSTNLNKAGFNNESQDIGLRQEDKLPELFLLALRSMQKGSLSKPIKTPSGVYILRLNDLKGAENIPEKRKAQHILISANTPIKIERARKKLLQLKRRALAGEDFASLAQYYSDDPGSAAKGGDLGWVRKGMMVPPFEQALYSLEKGQLSDIVLSQFGVHLIKLNDISRVEDSEEEARVIAFNALMSQKIDQYYPTWLSQLVGRAYVQYL